MLRAHQAVLKDLVERYETLRALHADKATEAARRRMNDAAYRLCEATGTREVDTALLVARHQLSRTRTAHGSLLSR
ncbi:DUF5133 domain-containing protein [Streptomyces sp. p1417]|uniref:DUF5133 domain-containing protein n=1 Tax=Streptomyces typhae TaxID=2681492 RepID=A0A6L6X4G1_9ACTN|nr:DUF5133 domain-containing protein [Streptomyces typhae]MVO88459.1 DUF5133 domain-containing protein [Streptomyces typhae]